MAADCERGNKLSRRPGQAQPPSWFPGLCEALSFPRFLNSKTVLRCTRGKSASLHPQGVLSIKFNVTFSRPFDTPPTHPSFIELYAQFLLLGIGLVFTNVGLAPTFFHLMLYKHHSLFTYTTLLFSSPLEWVPLSPVEPNCESP